MVGSEVILSSWFVFLHFSLTVTAILCFPFAVGILIPSLCAVQHKIKYNLFLLKCSSKSIRWELLDNTLNGFYFLEEKDGLKPIFHWCKRGKRQVLVWQVMNGWWEGIHLLHQHNGNGIVQWFKKKNPTVTVEPYSYSIQTHRGTVTCVHLCVVCVWKKERWRDFRSVSRYLLVSSSFSHRRARTHLHTQEFTYGCVPSCLNTNYLSSEIFHTFSIQ